MKYDIPFYMDTKGKVQCACMTPDIIATPRKEVYEFIHLSPINISSIPEETYET